MSRQNESNSELKKVVFCLKGFIPSSDWSTVGFTELTAIQAENIISVA